MRFDLTNASYRVLQRAAKQRLPGSSSEISAAKLLLSLFEEEECRAVVRLDEAGITLQLTKKAFHLDRETDVLQSPISAPGFAAGDYGIPPQVYSPPPAGTFSVQASPAEDRLGQVGYQSTEPQTPEEESAEHKTERPHPTQEPDAFQKTEEPARYSLYHHFEPNVHSRVKFYLDDVPVDFGRITRELESSLEIVVMRLARQNHRERSRHIPSANGGVTTVTNREDLYFPSFTLETEHLLLAAVLDESDTGRFLRDNGLEPAGLFQKYGEREIEDGTQNIGNGNAENEILEFSNAVASPVSRSPSPVFRIFDAAVNRCREAIRVVEDFVRFVLDDSVLTRQVKEFRHSFQETTAALPLQHRLDARDTEQDAGTEIEGQLEYERQTVQDVLSANFSRLQESLRSIEEYSKIAEPGIARCFEQLRYRSYTLHKIIALNSGNVEKTDRQETAERPVRRIRQRLDSVQLYALLDCREDEELFRTAADALISGGAGIIQLRDKHAGDRTILSRSRILKERIAAAQNPVGFVMNDRPDLAKIAGADGVHVGQDELSVAEVRNIAGPGLFVGVSTHNIEQARQAVLDGADYIGVGPVFESATKPFSEGEIAGADYLKEIAAENLAVPAFAIGGITLENLDIVLSAGIRRIVLGAALLNAEDPKNTAEEFLRRIGGSNVRAEP